MIRILYNGSCPICDAEICHYRSYAQRNGIAMGFVDLAHVDARGYGIDPEAALRRLHIAEGEEVFSGLPAFQVIWRALPRYRWLAWLSALPVMSWMMVRLYDYILAPLLYRAHLRRVRKQRR